MTHYDIDYTNIPESQKRMKALDDIRDYVGTDKFSELDGLLRQAIAAKQITSLDSFAMTLFMFPVSGYPIQAWYEVITYELENQT